MTPDVVLLPGCDSGVAHFLVPMLCGIRGAIKTLIGYKKLKKLISLNFANLTSQILIPCICKSMWHGKMLVFFLTPHYITKFFISHQWHSLVRDHQLYRDHVLNESSYHLSNQQSVQQSLSFYFMVYLKIKGWCIHVIQSIFILTIPFWF